MQVIIIINKRHKAIIQSREILYSTSLKFNSFSLRPWHQSKLSLLVWEHFITEKLRLRKTSPFLSFYYITSTSGGNYLERTCLSSSVLNTVEFAKKVFSQNFFTFKLQYFQLSKMQKIQTSNDLLFSTVDFQSCKYDWHPSMTFINCPAAQPPSSTPNKSALTSISASRSSFRSGLQLEAYGREKIQFLFNEPVHVCLMIYIVVGVGRKNAFILTVYHLPSRGGYEGGGSTNQNCRAALCRIQQFL